MSADELAFIAGICSQPACDTARLVYADWLDEQGRHERAEFIRVQVELAANFGRLGDERYTRLTRRADELLNWYAAPGVPAWAEWGALPVRAFSSIFRRGFVAHVTCTAADWLAHADSLCWSPQQTVECPLSYVEREGYACDVCGNAPDEEGRIEHGRGCYTQSEDGGGSSWVELPKCRLPRPCPPTAQPLERVTLTTWPEIQQSMNRPQWWRLSGPRGRDVYHFAPESELAAVAVLTAEWPGVAFELPPAVTPYIPPDPPVEWVDESVPAVDHSILNTPPIT